MLYILAILFFILVIDYCYTLFFAHTPGMMSSKDFLQIVINALGPVLAYIALAKQKRHQNEKRVKPFSLTPSFESGLFGGLLGGFLSGIIIGMGYFFQFKSQDSSVSPAIISEVVLYSSFAGAFIGAAIQLLLLWFRYLATEKKYPFWFFNEVIGGLIGGAISSCTVGISASRLFGFRHDPFVGVEQLLIGALAGVLFLSLGSLFYEFRGKLKNALHAFIISLLITFLTFSASIFIFSQFVNINNWYFNETSMDLMLRGGAIIGAVIGSVLGSHVGLTLLLYRLWESKELQ